MDVGSRILNIGGSAQKFGCSFAALGQAFGTAAGLGLKLVRVARMRARRLFQAAGDFNFVVLIFCRLLIAVCKAKVSCRPLSLPSNSCKRREIASSSATSSVCNFDGSFSARKSL